jgi:hypothetical protein
LIFCRIKILSENKKQNKKNKRKKETAGGGIPFPPFGPSWVPGG